MIINTIDMANRAVKKEGIAQTNYPLEKEVENEKNTILLVASLNAVIMLGSHLLLIQRDYNL